MFGVARLGGGAWQAGDTGSRRFSVWSSYSPAPRARGRSEHCLPADRSTTTSPPGSTGARTSPGSDPTNADVVGGALTAGKPAVPWAIFQQQEKIGEDQIFVRSFAGGAWTTRGNGTVGGRSSASPLFSGSLNFDQEEEGEVPAIDFAGHRPHGAVGDVVRGDGRRRLRLETNIFASRFDNTGDANQGKWIFAGQGRGTGGVGSVPVPSLNIHTDQEAENPSVAGGSAVDPTEPGPWVTWQETEAPAGTEQIFVVRPLGPGRENCDGVKPEGLAEGVPAHVPAIGGFCWQQVGVPRVGPGKADRASTSIPPAKGSSPTSRLPARATPFRGSSW